MALGRPDCLQAVPAAASLAYARMLARSAGTQPAVALKAASNATSSHSGDPAPRSTLPPAVRPQAIAHPHVQRPDRRIR